MIKGEEDEDKRVIFCEKKRVLYENLRSGKKDVLSFANIAKKTYFCFKYLHKMSTKEQKEIKSIATHYLKNKRSKNEILATLKSAGIIDKKGHISEPYNQIFSYK